MSRPGRRWNEHRCRRCHRMAREGKIYCHAHLADLSPHTTSDVVDLLEALEQLTEAAHGLLWDWETGARRGRRRPRVNDELANRLRYAARRAQDILIPLNQYEVQR